MSVYPERRKGRLTGKWIAEITRNGERIARKTFDLKRDADSWEGSLKLGESPILPDMPKGPFFGDVTKELLEASPRASDPSGRRRLEYVAEFIGDGTPVSDVSTVMMDKLVKALKAREGKARGSTTSPGTINRYLSAVSAVLKFARERYPKEVTNRITMPWQEDDGHRIDFLTELKEAEVLDYMLAQGWATSAFIVQTFAETGMRWSELYGLTAGQIEPETGWVRLWKTKNSEARSVPVSRTTAARLRQLVENKELPNYYTVSNHLKKATKAAGLPASFSIHALRHTTGTRLTQKGVPTRIVQKYLGHKNIQTTTKYAHVADEDLQNALEKISPRAGQSS
jgi:integrase